MTSLTNSLLADSIFLKRLICYLIPYFSPVTKSLDLAEADIIETLASYGARTRSELLNVVQIIAYSLSGLELLALAKGDTSMSASQQIRLRGCANNLHRCAHQAEKTLAARLKCDLLVQPGTPVKRVPTGSAQTGKAAAEPVHDTTTAQTEEILHRIDSQVAAARAAANPTKGGKAGAMFDTLFAEINSPPQPTRPQPPLR